MQWKSVMCVGTLLSLKISLLSYFGRTLPDIGTLGSQSVSDHAATTV